LPSTPHFTPQCIPHFAQYTPFCPVHPILPSTPHFAQYTPFCPVHPYVCTPCIWDVMELWISYCSHCALRSKMFFGSTQAKKVKQSKKVKQKKKFFIYKSFWRILFWKIRSNFFEFFDHILV